VQAYLGALNTGYLSAVLVVLWAVHASAVVAGAHGMKRAWSFAQVRC
jgi:hypothetical protein